jgi:hypothetical protein
MPAGVRHQACAVADASLTMFQGGGRNGTYIAKGAWNTSTKNAIEAIAICQTPWNENEKKKMKKKKHAPFRVA